MYVYAVLLERLASQEMCTQPPALHAAGAPHAQRSMRVHRRWTQSKLGDAAGIPGITEQLADLVCEICSAKRRACEHCIRDPAPQ